MTTTTDSQQQATAITYKLVALCGCLIDTMDEAERLRLKSPLFTMSLKNTATKFRTQLVGLEAKVTGYEHQDRTESLDQMADSYRLMDTLLDIHLQAGAKLSPDAQVVLLQEISGVLAKWGINQS